MSNRSRDFGRNFQNYYAVSKLHLLTKVSETWRKTYIKIQMDLTVWYRSVILMRKIYLVGLIAIMLTMVTISPVMAILPVTTNVQSASYGTVVNHTYSLHGRFVGLAAIVTPVKALSSYSRFSSYTQPVTSKTTTFTESDNGKTVTLTKGQVVKIQLDENPTTGYRWEPSVSSGIEITDDTYTASTSGRMGAGGTHTWTLKITGTGNQNFDANYKRSWETGSADSYSIQFAVE